MLPNADRGTTLSAIEDAADTAETLRRDARPVVLVVGCELSVFMRGILPGATHADRLALLTDPDRLVATVTAAGIDPQARFAEVLQRAAETARARFAGPVTYASGVWEQVEWTCFDIVGVDAYRDAPNRATYADGLRARIAGGRPVVVTEVGCATYRGAADAGAMAWTAVDRDGGVRRLRAGIERDESAQAAELDDLLETLDASGVDGAFIYTYVAPSYASGSDAASDLDAASFALVPIYARQDDDPQAGVRDGRAAVPPGSLTSATGPGLDVRIGEARLAAVHPVDELVVDPLVERRHLVLGQAALPAQVRPLRGIEPAVELPLLEAVVVRDLGAPEGVLEVGQGVRRAEEVLARSAGEHRVERVAVVGRCRRR